MILNRLNHSSLKHGPLKSSHLIHGSLTLSSSTKRLLSIVNRLLVVLLLCYLSACVKNEQLRTERVETNCLWGGTDCTNAILERYAQYDLGVIEFTERGNLYNRDDSNYVLRHINQLANTERGVAVFVFVHGWRHDADFNDDNVEQFRDFLSRASENEIVGKRKVVGVYLGWRGDFTRIPVAQQLSYWARKDVAEEVGDGGVTEVLSKLQQLVVQQFDDDGSADESLYKNTFVVIGHSLGGAIVLSALHDIMLKELVNADLTIGEGPNPCKKIKRFADAVMLLNPAIEANRVIQLKEVAARCLFGKDQPKLMHVLSSVGDTATRIFFPIGQYADFTRTLSPKKLQRKINGKEVILNESSLNVSTLGDLKQIRTAFLSFDEESKSWSLAQCRDDLSACGVKTPKAQANHIPTHENDPLVFIKTDKNFIEDHNDVFGCYVQSYITTVIFETQSVDKGYINADSNSKNVFMPDGCYHSGFDFKACFNNQLINYECDDDPR